MKRVAILGSTGSIGTSTLRVLEHWPDRFSVVALAGGSNVELMLEQIGRFKPGLVSVADPAAAERVRREFPGPGLQVLSGAEGLIAVAAESGADVVVSALVGSLGLAPTLAAISAGADIALANKETLVVAGELVTTAARERGVALLPVDSEHAALHQILDGRSPGHVDRLVLTASGGPFRGATRAQLEQVTLAEALQHPTWKMGSKITIDSATLANKGLEVIEARWLFGITADRIDVVVHPQSIIHGLVVMVDGTVLAQMGVNDMCCPIQYALTYPERLVTHVPALDLISLARLDFEAPDTDCFPCLRLAYQAAAAGGTAAAVFNAANEVANAAFRAERIRFVAIPAIVDQVLSALPATSAHELDAVLVADLEARRIAEREIGKLQT